MSPWLIVIIAFVTAASMVTLGVRVFLRFKERRNNLRYRSENATEEFVERMHSIVQDDYMARKFRNLLESTPEYAPINRIALNRIALILYHLEDRLNAMAPKESSNHNEELDDIRAAYIEVTEELADLRRQIA